MSRLIRNCAQCRVCGDVIESKNRHDFVSCRCGAIFLDGGLDYIRSGGDRHDFISLAEFDSTPGVIESGKE